MKSFHESTIQPQESKENPENPDLLNVTVIQTQNDYSQLHRKSYHESKLTGTIQMPESMENPRNPRNPDLVNLTVIQPQNDLDLDAIDSELYWLWNTDESKNSRFFFHYQVLINCILPELFF